MTANISKHILNQITIYINILRFKIKQKQKKKI